MHRMTVLAGVAIALASGCTGLSHGQRARTLGAGVKQTGGGGGVQLIAPDRFGVRLEGVYRHGLTDGIDIQLRGGGNASYCLSGCGEESDLFGSADIEGGFKFGLTPRDQPLAVSLAPSAILTLPYLWPVARVPLLVGYRYENGNESVVTAAVAATIGGMDLQTTLSYAHVIRQADGLVIPEVVIGRGLMTGRFYGQVGLTFVTGD